MADSTNGFKGAVAGLSLTDVIQLKGHNRYTGCIAVEYGRQSGAIYFVDGEIIHAEQGDESGEQAILHILRWPGGSFTLQPERTSNVCTIHYRTDHLLLEVLRRLDEEKVGRGQERQQPVEPSRRTMSKVAARLLQVPGVSYAVLMDKQGVALQDSSKEAVALAAKGASLAEAGDRLGELFGLGKVKAVALQARRFGLLVYDSRQHYLGIALSGDCQLDAVEAEVKATLVPGR